MGVVDGQHDPPVGREGAKERQQRGPDEPPFGRTVACSPQDSDLERLALRRRQALEGVGAELGQEVGQSREREGRFRLRGSRCEDARVKLAREGDCLLPDRCLADPGLADDCEHSLGFVGPQEVRGDGQLWFAPHEGRHGERVRRGARQRHRIPVCSD